MGSRTSSRKRIASRVSISEGVPTVCCTSERLPPVSRPVARPGRTARVAPRPIRVAGRGVVSDERKDAVDGSRGKGSRASTVGPWKARTRDFLVEHHAVAGALERLHAAREEPRARRVGECRHADRVATLKGWRAKEGGGRAGRARAGDGRRSGGGGRGGGGGRQGRQGGRGRRRRGGRLECGGKHADMLPTNGGRGKRCPRRARPAASLSPPPPSP